jgi:tRNA(Ile)-lysidine synthase
MPGARSRAEDRADPRVVVPRVRKTLRERALIPARARVLVACSGGPDSAALLFALRQIAPELQLALEVASVDHGLRPAAQQDVELAREQARRADVSFHPIRIDVPRDQGSLQAAARAARYEALLALAGRLGATRIAVGHTQDDQAETVLQRVLRGAGLAGLAAVSPLRADGVVRPLIDCRRADVLAFATEHAGEIARDPSNADRAFTRARVREELLPALLREDPQALSHLAALADDARDALALLEPQVRERVAMIRASCRANIGSKPGGMFDLSCLRDEPRGLRRLALKAWLTELIGAAALTRAHIESLDDALLRGGEVWLPRGWTALGSNDGHLSVTIDVARLNQ